MHLESRHLAPGTINLRLGAVRRLAYEAADSGLLSADLAAGIRRVKGLKKLGVRSGNWLTAEQAQTLWQAPDAQQLKGKRDRALLALLLACWQKNNGFQLEHNSCECRSFRIFTQTSKPSAPSRPISIGFGSWVTCELRAESR